MSAAARNFVAAVLTLALSACSGSKKDGDDVSGGSGGGAGSANSYALCDGSQDIRLGVVVEGGFVETTYEHTNPYGHSFLFVDGRCHYYASESWLKGVVQGDLSQERAAQISKALALPRVQALDYHDAESCPDAGAVWVRTAAGYVDCTCGCDAKAPAGVEAAIDAAGELKLELLAEGEPLAGPIRLLAVVEDKPLGSGAGVAEWPLIWPLSDIGMTWESLSRRIQLTTRLLSGRDAETVRMLRARRLESDPHAGSLQTTDLGKTYSLFMREELPESAQRAVEALTSP